MHRFCECDVFVWDMCALFICMVCMFMYGVCVTCARLKVVYVCVFVCERERDGVYMIV